MKKAPSEFSVTIKRYKNDLWQVTLTEHNDEYIIANNEFCDNNAEQTAIGYIKCIMENGRLFGWQDYVGTKKAKKSLA